MAAYTSVKSGDWNDVAVWSSGFPIAGDTFTISSNHTIFVRGIEACASGTCNGNLKINDNCPLTLSGNLTVVGSANNGTVTLYPSSSLKFSGTDRQFIFNGTAANPVSLVSVSAGPNNRPYFGGATNTDNVYFISSTGLSYDRLMSFNCSYVDFRYVFDTVNLYFINNGQHGGTVDNSWYFTHCLFDYCGNVRYGSGSTPGGDVQIKLVNCDFRHPKHTQWIDYTAAIAINPEVVKFVDCTFSGTSVGEEFRITNGSTGANDILVSGCIFEDTFYNNLGGYPVTADFVHWYNAYVGSNQNCYNTSNPGGWMVNDSVMYSTVANAHMCTENGTAPTSANTWQDNILYASDSAANLFGFNRPITMQRNTTIGGNGCVSTSTNAGTVDITRHTHIHKTANFDTTLLFETSNFTGTVNFTSSILYGIANAAEHVINSIAAAQTLGRIGYNCNYNVGGTVYNNVSITTDNTGNDITSNPLFNNVDVTIAAWDTSLGGAGTVSNAFAEMLKLNGFARDATPATFNPAYSKSALLTYLRSGFTPRNRALKQTGYLSVDIGSQAYNPLPPKNTMLGLG